MKQSRVALWEVEVGLGLRVLPQGQSSEKSRKEKEAPGPRGEWDEGRGDRKGCHAPGATGAFGRAKDGDEVGKAGWGQFRGFNDR